MKKSKSKIPAFLRFCISAVVFSILLSGCVGGKKVPNLDRIFATAKTQTGKRPVIIVPGILGSELVNADTGEKVWVNFSKIKGDDLSLPISPDLSKNRDSLVAKQILKTVKISRFLPEVSVYQTLTDAMERYGGYTEGDWENPDVSQGGFDKYYVFAYDWRLDNVENARLLIRKIERLKEKLNKSEMRFNILAHSMGGLIARYAAMYGDADLPENGEKPMPNWDGARHFNKIFMFGTPNEGSMATLDTLLNGYRIGRFSIDALGSESVITSPAVFQLLPHQGTAHFYDENLEKIEINLFDAETWKRYGWSAFAQKNFRDKFIETSLADLDKYFTNVLKRAKAFHDAIDADTSVPASIVFFAFGSDCDNTQDGTIIRKNPKTGNWETIFSPKSYKTSDGRQVTRKMTAEKLYAPGDFRVTRRSLLAETITQQNYRNSIFRQSLPVSATFFCEAHDVLPNNKIVQNNFLTALVSEILK